MYATIQPQQHHRQGSYADSIDSDSSTSTSRQSPAPPIINNYQPRFSSTSAHQQQNEEKLSYHTPPVSTSRRSSDRFPPPPSNLETLDLTVEGINKPRSGSSISTRSLAYADANEVNIKSKFYYNIPFFP